MANLRNKKELAALNRENIEEQPRSKLAQDLKVPRSQEDYKTQNFEETEGRLTKKLSQEFGRTENCTLGALPRLAHFFMNQLNQGHSGTAPETSWIALSMNQGTNEDDSQSHPHREAGILHNQTTQNSSPADGHDMMTGVHEEVSYCSHSRSSGEQKNNRSTCQPQFRSENTPATIELDQILLALQQLAINNNSANLHNNNNRTSKLPKSLTTTMPMFDGKPEKFELFEDLFQTSLKILISWLKRLNYFHSIMRADALQTYKINNGPTRENLGENLALFRRKNVKPQSMATAKHKFQKLVFKPANQKLVDFLDKLQKLAKNVFGIAANAIIEQFIYAKMPPHLKKSKN